MATDSELSTYAIYSSRRNHDMDDLKPESQNPLFLFIFQHLLQLGLATTVSSEKARLKIRRDEISVEAIRQSLDRLRMPVEVAEKLAVDLHRRAVEMGGNPPLAGKAVLRVKAVVITLLPQDEMDRALMESAAEAEDLGFVTLPASSAAISGLKEERLENSTCTICLEDLATVRLPCSHAYHKDCIVHWLQINHVCPLCRHPMPSAPHYST